jgi:hypothetical protein
MIDRDLADALRTALEPVRAQLDELILEQRATCLAAGGARAAAERAVDQGIEFATAAERFAARLEDCEARIGILERAHAARTNGHCSSCGKGSDE